MGVLFTALLWLWLYGTSTCAKKLTASTLATARVNDAVLYLSQLQPNDLDEECRELLQPLQFGLIRSGEWLETGENDDALGELGVVENSLDKCLVSMKKIKTPEALRARSRLRRAGRSVSNADQLIQIARHKHAAKNDLVFTPQTPGQSSTPTVSDQGPESPPSEENVFATMPVSGAGYKTTDSASPHSPSLYSTPGFESPKFLTGETGNIQPKSEFEQQQERLSPQFSTSSGSSKPPPSSPPSPASRFFPESATQVFSGITPTITISQPGEPLTSILIDYCSNHVKVKENSVTMRLDKACGAKFHSAEKYSSGVFSAWIRTPVKASGVSASFYLSSNDYSPDTIGFDFFGNNPKRISTSYTAQGRSDKAQQTFAVSFDTSVKFHKYTIKWDSESIMWLVDGVLYQTIAKGNNQPYPTKPAHVFGLIWDASHVSNGALAGSIDWQNSPFVVYYNDVIVMSPLAAGSWKLPPQSSMLTEYVPTPMRPLVIDDCGSNVDVTDTDVLLKYDHSRCGGRVRSISRYLEGTFTTRVKCDPGDTSGLVSSFYLSSLHGSPERDEISFEWLGFNKHVVETNLRVNGRGGNDEVIDLNFDCSQGFHKYTIKYSKQHIQWLVDDRVLRTVTFAQQSLLAGTPYPVKPMFVYSSVYNGSDVNNGKWAGLWHGTGMPYTVTYSDITIKASS